MKIDNSFIKQKLDELIVSNPNINQITFGKKQTSGSYTEEDSFVFGVTQKKPLDQLPEDEVIPALISSGSVDIKTDVVETLPIYSLDSYEFLSTATNISGSTVTLGISVEDISGSLFIRVTPSGDEDLILSTKELENLKERIFAQATRIIETGVDEATIAITVPPECPEDCYRFRSNGIQSTYHLQLTRRPLRAGLQIQSEDLGQNGTMGLIAIDNYTGGITGVTNAHVVTPRNLINSYYHQYYTTTDSPRYSRVGNSTPTGITPAGNNKELGPVMRYVAIDPNIVNRVDGAVFIIAEHAIDPDVSYQQFQSVGYPVIFPFPEDVTYPLTFATTAEIDSIDSSTELASVGRTTGCKEGICGLRLLNLDTAVRVAGYGATGGPGLPNGIVFSPVISFTRINPDCPYPIAGGDSGSSLLAKINGIWKVVGLNFAGNGMIGYACRIDNVASELNISAWDGSTPSYINPNSMKSFTVEGVSDSKTLTVGGTVYHNAGKTTTIGTEN